MKLNGLASPVRLRLQVFSTSWRFHPPRAWWPCFVPHPLMGLCPSEPCSSRAAVRRLRRRCPHVVRTNPPTAPPSVAAGRSRLHRTAYGAAPGAPAAFRASLRARVRHRIAAFYTARRRVALLGFAPSRVLPLTGTARPSPGLPSRASLVQARTTGRAHPSGSRFQRGWLVSLETADPPGLCRLVTITNVWFGPGSGVTSSGFGVRHRPLASHL
jgi:hypothetical protein